METRKQHVVLARALLAVAILVSMGIAAEVRAQGRPITIRVIETRHPLKFFRGKESPPDGWNELDFDDSSWDEGLTPLGYGETAIQFNAQIDDMRGSYLTVYVRMRFPIERPSLVDNIRLTARYDDGFVAYLNGTELARSSMPPGTPTKDTAATDHEFTGSTFSRKFTQEQLDGILVRGDNVLAVEVHNTSINSSDLVFDPGLRVAAFPLPDPEFIRGVQCDGSDALDIGDPIYLLRWRFGDFYAEPGCVKACDMNDDGEINLSDAVFALNFLFQGGEPFPAPYPDLGTDETDDDLTCLAGEEQ